MKKSILFILVSLFAFQMASARDIITMDMEKLPKEARNVIAKHFPSEKVSYIKIDEELLYITYEVVFVNGSEIEFAEDGQWIEIDCKHSEVPAGLVPEKIGSYVKQNFATSFITQIEKKRHGYEVELSNNLDLRFDRSGNFRRFDD